MKTWALIPARGGSKGLPRKNILPVLGRPLLAHTIEAAKDADRTFVSTDDPEIAEVATRFGAEVPFLRPARLATDTASVRDALFHTLDRLVEREGHAPDAIVVMFATSPFRPPGLLRELVRRLDRAYCATTVGRVGAFVKSLGCGTAMRYTPPGLRPFESRGRFLKAGHPSDWAFVVADDPACFVDIDTPEDLDLRPRTEHHPATLYRTLGACPREEGALTWTRGYDADGNFVLQTPVIRIGKGPDDSYRVVEREGTPAFVETPVVRECEPERATMWFPPTVDWLYDIGSDLRVRPEGPILGRQDHELHAAVLR